MIHASTLRSRSADVLGLLAGAVNQVFLWAERAAERRHLAGLGDHVLKDIGLSRADVARESSKPFWRP